MKVKGGSRGRAYYRHHRRRVIQRKMKLAKEIGWHIPYAGRFAKGKIHCSCYYCREKTSDLGLPKSDRVRLDRTNVED